MPFPAEASYNPTVSPVVVLGPSSGNPKSFQDPKNVASMGLKLQAMSDQASADTLYDTRKEGFLSGSAYNANESLLQYSTSILIIVGSLLILRSMF